MRSYMTFPQDAIGKAIPYGIYDMARNEAYVSVGRDHDTPAFAVASIRRWWLTMGRPAYPNAEELLVTADAGGSNGYRSRAWKAELQKLADEVGLRICVSPLPARHQQVEQGGASAFLPYHPELAGQAAQNVRGRRAAHWPHSNGRWSMRHVEAGRWQVPDWRDHHGRRNE
jgi:hypothetical protein